MAVPNTFATATSAIPLANLDANFAYYDGAFSISGTATTFAGSVTLTSGTANGVAYLNGSKVLTTGSALTFDGTNMGIGASSPTAIYGKTLQIASGTTEGSLSIVGSTGNGYVATVGSAFTISGRGGMALSLGTNDTEKVRIDTSGNVGIGTSSPACRLDVTTASVNSLQARFGNVAGRGLEISTSSVATINDSGSVLNAKGAGGGTLIFQTDTTERARIDSSGNLLVGSTSNGENARLLAVLATNTASVIQASNAYAASSGLTTFYSSLGNGTNSVSNTNCYHLKAISQGSATYYLYGNGTTSFTSDKRLKKNIETTRDGYAQDLCKLRVVKYQWNTEPDDGPKELGLIAQEVEQVFPGLIQDAAEEIQGFTPKVLKASVLPMMLLKAIQEQQALITSLTARIEALESR